MRSSPRASMGLIMLPASMAPSAAPAPDDGVELVDEGDDLPAGVGNLFQDRLQALLELAPVLGPGHHRAEVEGEQALAPQAFRYVSLDDPAGQALHDGRLAHAGLADEHGVVLRPPRQDLDHPADFLVPADDRVELAPAGLLGQVATVLFQCLIGLFGVLARHPVAASHLASGRPAGRRGRPPPAWPWPAGRARRRGTRHRGLPAPGPACSSTSPATRATGPVRSPP